jgi:hypothetical protein
MHELDSRLEEKLAVLKAVPDRPEEAVRRGRAAFLQEVQSLGSEAVTLPEKRRHIGWMQIIKSFTLRRKEHSPMFNILATILLLASFIIGGSGLTVAAAQSSQPNQALYGVKVISEDLQMNLPASPASAYQTALKFATRRTEEIQKLQESGSVPSEEVVARYKEQVEQAIRFALELPDDQAVPALEKIQTQLQTQLKIIQLLPVDDSSNLKAVLSQVETMLQERLQWTETGAQDPAHLREQLKEQLKEQRKEDSHALETPDGTTTPAVPTNALWLTGTPQASREVEREKDSSCENCTAQPDGKEDSHRLTGTPAPGSHESDSNEKKTPQTLQATPQPHSDSGSQGSEQGDHNSPQHPEGQKPEGSGGSESEQGSGSSH